MINKVILIGRLGQDPDIRHTKSGATIANLTVATAENWKDKQGDWQEKTEWHRVVVFGKLAESVERKFAKGALVYVEGKLQTRKWEDQSGQTRYTTEIVVDIKGTIRALESRQEKTGHDDPVSDDEEIPF